MPDQADQFSAGALAAAFEALPIAVAVLDPRGIIQYTNAAWRVVNEALLPEARVGPGVDYVAHCRGRVAALGGVARAVADGTVDVLEGRVPEVDFEIWRTPAVCTRARVTRLEGGGALVVHDDVTSVRASEARAARLAHDLGERVKEQRAVYEAARLLREDVPLGTLLARVAALLPAAMQFPDVTDARVWAGAEAASTPGYTESPWRLSATFTTADGMAGGIDVVYRDERPASDEGPFLAEERYLIDSLADMLRAAAELRARDERFRQLAENIAEVFWLTDAAKQTMLYISPAYERIWGRPRDGLYRNALQWIDAIHDEDRERVRASLADQTSGAYEIEYRVVRPDGDVRWILDRAFPVRDEHGRVYRIAGVAQDVTERHAFEERLAEQAALLDAAHDAIYVVDAADTITYWNRGAELVFGFARADAVGSRSRDLLAADTEAFDTAHDVLARRGAWSGELPMRSSTGDTLTMQVRWTRVNDRSGRPRAVLAINSDMTDRRKLEAQIMRAQRLESINTLAGGVAHDLNNVLAPILMSIDVLRDGRQTPERLELLDTMEASATRGAQLVRQLLAFARGGNGTRGPVDMGRVAADIQKIVFDTFPKNIRFALVQDEHLRLVLGDSTQLYQVLMNLAVNARDAMPHGGELTIALATRREVDEPAAHAIGLTGPAVVVEVRDTGHGIAPEDQGRIFDPFFTTKDVGKGTGLGLSTVAAIVKSHGGVVTVESQPGRGSTFRVYLPVAPEATPFARMPAKAAAPATGRGQLVLVIDDDDGVRRLCARILERAGYRVVEASDGVEGLERFRERPEAFALVITDMAMPNMDGRETVIALKRIRADVPIIGSTGHAAIAGVPKAWASGVVRVITKPYAADTLLAAVARALQHVARA